MKHIMNKGGFCRMALLIIMLLTVSTKLSAQEIIRVAGQVVMKGGNKPVIGANIVDAKTKHALATTDLDGKFAVNVRTNAKLRFSMVGMKPKDVDVKGRKRLHVVLDEDNVSLSEVTVLQKRITDKIITEPTDIEVKGNYFHVKTRIRVPDEMFAHDTRLVLQPVLKNATKKQTTLMKPVVYDAREYHRTQDRLYNFDMNNTADGDPLAKYVVVKSKSTRENGKNNDIISYRDSIYVDNIKDDFACDIYMAIEDYTHILYRDTTTIANGTVNPLRFLKIDFASQKMTDENYIPKPETQLRDSKGEVNLRFPMNKTKFDPKDPQNAEEISKLHSQINAIMQSPGASLNSLTLVGMASPEGRYKLNTELAEKRMNFAIRYIRSTLPQSLTKDMAFKSSAKVAPWWDVVSMLHNDNKKSEAEAIKRILEKYKTSDVQNWYIKHLPFFQELLAKKYLPKMRKVEYSIHYNIYRTLTKEEIEVLYQQDYTQLSKFEFYKLYSEETDSLRRHTIMRQALEVYPSFVTAANDLAADMINCGQPDPELLSKFAGEDAPTSVNVNQVIALLNSGKYTDANAITQYINENEDTKLILAINNAMNGKLEESYKTIRKTGKRNETLMLLAMKRNKEAFEECKELNDDEALTHYLRAICLNRLNQPVEAEKELSKAFEMDPSLKETAKVDGDVNDLLSINN